MLWLNFNYRMIIYVERRRNNMMKRICNLITLGGILLISSISSAQVDPADIYCTIRETGAHLNCQWVGKDARRSLSPDEIAQFVDRSEVAAYISVRGRKGVERAFYVDPDAPQFRKLSEIKKTGSISEISKAKNDLFSEIEKKAIKISDDLDAQMSTAELVKYDNSFAVEKYKRELRKLDQELLTFKKDASPNKAYEQGEASLGAGEGSVATNKYGSKYELLVGLGTGTNTLGLNGRTSSASPLNYNLDARAHWSEKFLTDFEFISGAAVDYSRINIYNTNYSGTGLTTSYMNLKDYYCWNRWCAGLNILNYTYVAANKWTTSSQAKLSNYSDLFVGLSAFYRAMYGNWLILSDLTFYQGTSYTSNNMFNNKTVSGNWLTEFNLNFEKQISGPHGFSGQLNYQQIFTAINTAPAVTNTYMGINALYKYQF